MATATKKPFQIYLRKEQLETLRALSVKRGVSVAELVRQGVDQLLATIPVEEDPLFELVGLGESDAGDLAVNHDRYLTELEEQDNQA